MTSDRPRVRLVRVVVRPLQAFLRLEAASGILLLLCAIFALVWANMDPGSYGATFDYRLLAGAGGAGAAFTLRTLINDGLMAVFFFVVGMEIKRELVVGELNSVAKASLPAIAAVGGMLLPAGIFLAFNRGGTGQRGWGIPMATDIAFSIGILTLLKDRVPRALVVFVTALAIFDAIVGVGLWYALHHSGIHATIAGVVLGLMIPARPQRSSRDGLRGVANRASELDRKPPDEELGGAEILPVEENLENRQPPVQRFVYLLHPFVAFLIVPVFALANSGVSVRGAGISMLASPVALGTAVGLFIGKQVGIFALTSLAVRLRLAPMPGNASWAKLFGVSAIAGIGFTVALFIAALAFHDAVELLDQAKMGILIGSIAAGIVGFVVLRSVGAPQEASAHPQRERGSAR